MLFCSNSSDYLNLIKSELDILIKDASVNEYLIYQFKGGKIIEKNIYKKP